MDAIFSAVDITGLSSGVQTILIGGVTCILAFVGYKFAKKAANRL
jgi:hypothetical protein